jgi:hypothetical protein
MSGVAMKSPIVGHITNSEPAFIKSVSTTGGTSPDAFPNETIRPRGFRHASEAFQAAAPIPS